MSRALLLALVLLAAPAQAQARYFRELPDVPLPPGFTETNLSAGFDGPRGRLVVAEATGAETPAQVRSFYAACMSALGWSATPVGDGGAQFVRGRERLTLDLSQGSGRTRLRLELVASAAPANDD